MKLLSETYANFQDFVYLLLDFLQKVSSINVYTLLHVCPLPPSAYALQYWVFSYSLKLDK